MSPATDELQIILVWIIPTLFAITVHEASHGYAAYYLGDKTSFIIGRMTLNPFKHVDPMGTILVPTLMILTGTGFIFGWAKPVPINQQILKKPQRDMAIVAMSGPISNLIMACLWGGLYKLNFHLHSESIFSSYGLHMMSLAGVKVNFMLAAINLLPIPPLDGSRLVSLLLPKRLSYFYNLIEDYGFLIILAMLLTGILSHIVIPIDSFFKITLADALNLTPDHFFQSITMKKNSFF